MKNNRYLCNIKITTMEDINRIKVVQQMGVNPTTVSKWCTLYGKENTIKRIFLALIAVISFSFAVAQTNGNGCFVFYDSKGDCLEIRKGSNGKQGIWNRRLGKFEVPCKYEFFGFTASRRGYCVFEDDKYKYGIIDADLNVLVPLGKYKMIYTREIPNNCWVARDYNDKYGIINERGNIIAPFVFQTMNTITTKNGLIVAKYNGKYGLIDRYGNTAYPFIYDNMEVVDFESEDLINKVLYGENRVTKREPAGCFARVEYNGYRYRVDDRMNVIGTRERIASANSYTKKSSYGTLFVAGAVIAGVAALIANSSKSSSSSSSSSYSSSSSSSSSSANTPRSLYEGCNVKCIGSSGSGYYGRVTAINGDKCKVYIDRVVLKGWLTLYLGANQYTGWKDLSYTTHYDYDLKKQFYGRGEIIEVPKSCLEIVR